MVVPIEHFLLHTTRLISTPFKQSHIFVSESVSYSTPKTLRLDAFILCQLNAPCYSFSIRTPRLIHPSLVLSKQLLPDLHISEQETSRRARHQTSLAHLNNIPSCLVKHIFIKVPPWSVRLERFLLVSLATRWRRWTEGSYF